MKYTLGSRSNWLNARKEAEKYGGLPRSQDIHGQEIFVDIKDQSRIRAGLSDPTNATRLWTRSFFVSSGLSKEGEFELGSYHYIIPQESLTRVLSPSELKDPRLAFLFDLGIEEWRVKKLPCIDKRYPNASTYELHPLSAVSIRAELDTPHENRYVARLLGCKEDVIFSTICPSDTRSSFDSGVVVCHLNQTNLRDTFTARINPRMYTKDTPDAPNTFGVLPFSALENDSGVQRPVNSSLSNVPLATQNDILSALALGPYSQNALRALLERVPDSVAQTGLDAVDRALSLLNKAGAFFKPIIREIITGVIAQAAHDGNVSLVQKAEAVLRKL